MNFKRDNITFTSSLFVLSTTLLTIFSVVIFYDPTFMDIYEELPTVFALFKGFGFTLFFTTISNIFLGITMMLLVIKKESKVIKRLFFNAACLMAVTSVVFWSLIIFWSAAWYNYPVAFMNVILHFVNPIIGLLILYLFRKEVKIKLLDLFIPIFWFVVYYFIAILIYVATYGIFKNDTGVVIYSFLNFRKPLFYSGDNSIVIFVLNFVILLGNIYIPLLLTIILIKSYKIKLFKKTT